MMGFKHFGILSIEKYRNYNMDQLIEVLGKKNIINFSIHGIIKENKTLNKKGGFEKIIQFRPDEIQKDFTDNFLDIIYLFLKNYMNELIKVNTMLFNQNFENKTFGFSHKKQKKDALKIFNNFFVESFDSENIDSYSAIGNKFHALKKRQDNLVQKLRNETGNWIIVNYLLGNKDYFNRELFDTHPLLIEIFEFENKLSVLLDLNKKFKFEEYTIFTPKSKAELIYEEYSYDFDSLKQVEFIENQIHNEKKVDRAFIVSLFDFFSNKLKMTTPSGKVFGEIINNHFGFDFYEIGLNGSEGDRHSKRVEGFKKEWESFTN